jgi:hypothetical protein
MRHILKAVNETIIKVHYEDLNDFINKVTGQEYDCVLGEDWLNNSLHFFVVDGDFAFHKEWMQFKSNKDNGRDLIETILNGLCAEKYIDPGYYVITVKFDFHY